MDLEEIKVVAGKIASYTKEELEKLSAFIKHEFGSDTGITTNGTPVPAVKPPGGDGDGDGDADDGAGGVHDGPNDI
jgi:hypothetical protein